LSGKAENRTLPEIQCLRAFQQIAPPEKRLEPADFLLISDEFGIVFTLKRLVLCAIKLKALDEH
jgi:hypothetical protein